MKKKNLLKMGAAALALTVGVSCFAGCGSTNYAENNTEFYIGCSGPLTGGAAIYGTAVKNAAEMAVKEINDAGGIGGVKIKFVMMDDVHNADNVPTNYAKMKEGGMQMSLGCVTSTPCLTFKAEAEADDMFILTPSATSDQVPEDASNVYQMCFSDSGQGSGAASYIAKNYASAKIGVFYKSDDVYSKGIYDQFYAHYTGNKSALVVATFNDANKTDFGTQINQLKDCDFVFMPIYCQEATLFIQQAQGQVANNAVFFGCDGFDGIDGQSGFNVNTIPQEISYLSHFDSNATTGKAGEFVTKYKQAYKAETLNQFGASAYDCIYALKKAIETANANGKDLKATTSPQDMSKALQEVFNSASFSFDGVTGTNIKWNADGTVVKTPVKYVVNEK